MPTAQWIYFSPISPVDRNLMNYLGQSPGKLAELTGETAGFCQLSILSMETGTMLLAASDMPICDVDMSAITYNTHGDLTKRRSDSSKTWFGYKEPKYGDFDT
jgi:hypothetical protein